MGEEFKYHLVSW